MGEMGTLWLALAFCFAGGVIAMISLRHVKTPGHMHNLTPREKFAELSRGSNFTLYQPQYFSLQYCAHYKYLIVIRFAVIMPMMFVDELGFHHL
ncbi:putative ribitol transporter [Escherichia coli]|uniref:Putative ribitol transporter n=1 Tax=Escherichia coli TaxID=562 RepID=A0A2X1MX85_ECOLX|nr:putative ribitol transporter [Escherichia coli]